MKLAAAAATMCLLWCMMAIVPSIALLGHEEIGEKLGYVNITFDITNGVTSYTSFLTRLRNKVEAPTRVCGLRSTRSTSLPGAEYFYANLKISDTRWVTLGIDIKSLYVWGYQDNVRYNGNYRASFFRDAPEEAKSKLFRGSTVRTTRFGGTYGSLEAAADTSRIDLVLGIEKLNAAVHSVYRKQEGELNQGTAEAKFLLTSVQMVSEAARFKFMEEAIVQNDNTPQIKRKMKAFQNDWGQISNKIHKAEAAKPKCTKIIPTLVISNVGYRQEVHTVAEIKNDIGILKYKTN